MASANSNVQMTGLDFQDIKSNMIRFMQGQDTFKDYNFSGSGLSVLMDILAYNTQYNAYYLNMVANEMFLDTALQRSSVVSQSKVLGYIPKSSISPTATINVTVYGVTQSSLTLDKFTPLISRAIDGVNYTFLTDDTLTVNTQSGTALFENVIIKQGTPSKYSFVVSTASNPKCIFEIPDVNIDTSSLTVSIQQSSVNTNTKVFQLATTHLTLDGTSKVYFLQEGLSGNYEVYFGNGVLGQKLMDGNIVRVSYISTKGTAAHGANNFSLIQGIGGYANTTIVSVTAATNGNEKETIESIKYQAPKSFSSQNRAVTKDDYITVIQQNQLGLTFDAVNVWGGEENDVPVFGQVFICLKPAGAYNITETQKQRLIQEVIKPISVMTVSPTIVNPDYTYLKLNINVIYDPNKTTQTSAQIESGIKSAIYGFANATLNTFNSTFNSYELMKTVQDYSNSIITSEYDLKLQKKFFPSLVTPSTYKLYYNTPLDKGMFLSGVSSSPSIQFRDPSNLVNIIDGIYVEELPSPTNGVESISMLNPGSQYQSVPTITILGDGTGAKAHAILSGGSIKNVVIDAAGSGYTAAIVNITPQPGDTTGKLAAGVVNLQGKFGTLRTYYNNTSQVKTTFNQNVGVIDYMNGIITLNSFSPIGIDNPLGQFTVTVKPTTSIISSSYNRIITIDPYDANAVTVNVIAKS